MFKSVKTYGPRSSKIIQYGMRVWLVMCQPWVRAPSKGPRYFLEQETSPLLFSTGWFQERIRAWFHNRTKLYWGPYMEDWPSSNMPLVKNIVKTKYKTLIQNNKNTIQITFTYMQSPFEGMYLCI